MPEPSFFGIVTVGTPTKSIVYVPTWFSYSSGTFTPKVSEAVRFCFVTFAPVTDILL